GRDPELRAGRAPPRRGGRGAAGGRPPPGAALAESVAGGRRQAERPRVPRDRGPHGAPRRRAGHRDAPPRGRAPRRADRVRRRRAPLRRRDGARRGAGARRGGAGALTRTAGGPLVFARLHESLGHVPRTLRLVWRSSPGGGVALGALTLLAAVVPLGI